MSLLRKFGNFQKKTQNSQENAWLGANAHREVNVPIEGAALSETSLRNPQNPEPLTPIAGRTHLASPAAPSSPPAFGYMAAKSHAHFQRI